VMDRPTYVFGFVLCTTIGNLTRYVNLRKYAERDLQVECYWTPVTHVVTSAPKILRLLPRAIGLRAWVTLQMMPGLRRLGRFDAVMLHLFEAETVCVALTYFRRGPALISSTDEAPVVDRSTYPLYAHQLTKSAWRHQFRLRLDRWRAARISAFIPFSAWGGRLIEASCAVPQDRIFPIHVGLDLEIWTPPAPKAAQRTGLPKLLFVGSDFVRKGGELLVKVFAKHFIDVAELHLVTAQAPAQLPRNVYAYRDLAPSDARLIQLYADCDVLVLPTTADLHPWVALEAMAMRLPVISTNVGAIPEIVRHGVTGLIVEKGNEDALTQSIQRLLNDAETRVRMGDEGRAQIERNFNASINVPRILAVMKSVVDSRLDSPSACRTH
jgi:glycosyltransferase involved in cell wall biosynthesis